MVIPGFFGFLGVCSGKIEAKDAVGIAKGSYYVGAFFGGLTGVVASVGLAVLGTGLLSASGSLETLREESYLEGKMVGVVAYFALISMSYAMGIAKDATTFSLLSQGNIGNALINDRFGYLGLSLANS